MQIYNSQSRRKETFVPLHEGKVGIYACGPTVYNYFHIGNARPFITFDVLRRYLEHKGYDVTFVQNFTDIDDKMIKRANEEGITVKSWENALLPSISRMPRPWASARLPYIPRPRSISRRSLPWCSGSLTTAMPMR